MSTLTLHSPRVASVDVLRANRASWMVQVAGIVGFAVLTALGSQVRLYIWEVPFTLQTLAVYGSGLFLGWRNGFLSQVLYLSLGLFLPVYAGDTYGPAYLFTAASAGYLLAFPVVALVTGALSARWNTFSGVFLTMICGSLIMFGIGVTWLHFAMGHADWLTSIERGWLRFIPVDIAKMLLVGFVYTGLRRL